MRLLSVSQILYGSAAFSAAAAFPRPAEEDDTPLPLVIWHGTPTPPTPPHIPISPTPVLRN